MHIHKTLERARKQKEAKWQAVSIFLQFIPILDGFKHKSRHVHSCFCLSFYNWSAFPLELPVRKFAPSSILK